MPREGREKVIILERKPVQVASPHYMAPILVQKIVSDLVPILIQKNMYQIWSQSDTCVSSTYQNFMCQIFNMYQSENQKS